MAKKVSEIAKEWSLHNGEWGNKPASWWLTVPNKILLDVLGDFMSKFHSSPVFCVAIRPRVANMEIESFSKYADRPERIQCFRFDIDDLSCKQINTLKLRTSKYDTRERGKKLRQTTYNENEMERENWERLAFQIK